MKCFLVLVFVFFTPLLAVEQSADNVMTGNKLLPICRIGIAGIDREAWKDEHESFDAGYCAGLVEGVSYGSPSVCRQDGVVNVQLARVVVKFLEDNPDKLHLYGPKLVEEALAKAFPCQHKK